MFGSSMGWTEILIVLGVILLIFGPKRLPQLSRALGQSVRELKRGLNDVKSDIETAANEEPETKPTSVAAAQSVEPAKGTTPAKSPWYDK